MILTNVNKIFHKYAKVYDTDLIIKYLHHICVCEGEKETKYPKDRIGKFQRFSRGDSQDLHLIHKE